MTHKSRTQLLFNNTHFAVCFIFLFHLHIGNILIYRIGSLHTCTWRSLYTYGGPPRSVNNLAARPRLRSLPGLRPLPRLRGGVALLRGAALLRGTAMLLPRIGTSVGRARSSDTSPEIIIRRLFDRACRPGLAGGTENATGYAAEDVAVLFPKLTEHISK